jgi:hypothetical protein
MANSCGRKLENGTKVVLAKDDDLRRELHGKTFICNGTGFGSDPENRGNAVFGKFEDGTAGRIEGYMIDLPATMEKYGKENGWQYTQADYDHLLHRCARVYKQFKVKPFQPKRMPKSRYRYEIWRDMPKGEAVAVECLGTFPTDNAARKVCDKVVELTGVQHYTAEYDATDEIEELLKKAILS